MFQNVTPEKVIAFVRLSVALTYCWPPPFSATKERVLRFKLIRSALFLNAFALLLPLLYALHVYRDDMENLSKAACLAISVGHIITGNFFYITGYERFQTSGSHYLLQRLIEEMKGCCKNAKSYERRVLQRYVGEYSAFYVMSAVWAYMTATVMIAGTLFISDPFPTNAAYPFSVDHEPLRTAVFIQQAFVGLQCAAHVCVNIFLALLLLFAAARFEALMVELREVRDNQALIECLRRYYHVKRYAKEVIDVIQMIVLNTVIICGVVTVFCGIIFIGRHPFTVKFQILCVTGTALLEVFMCALPADHLFQTSENAMRAVYESSWHEQPLRQQKSVLLTLLPQPAVVLRVKCLIPVLSLNYYCSFISNVFSFFTAFRIVMVEEEGEA